MTKVNRSWHKFVYVAHIYKGGLKSNEVDCMSVHLSVSERVCQSVMIMAQWAPKWMMHMTFYMSDIPSYILDVIYRKLHVKCFKTYYTIQDTIYIGVNEFIIHDICNMILIYHTFYILHVTLYWLYGVMYMVLSIKKLSGKHKIFHKNPKVGKSTKTSKLSCHVKLLVFRST